MAQGSGAERFCSKALKDGVGTAPTFRRQVSLDAYLAKQLNCAPLHVGPDLRKKQSVTSAAADHHAMGPDAEIVGRSELLERRQHRNLNGQILDLISADPLETRVMQRRAQCHLFNCLPQRHQCLHDSPAPAQTPPVPEGDEHASKGDELIREHWSIRNARAEMVFERGPRDA